MGCAHTPNVFIAGADLDGEEPAVSCPIRQEVVIVRRSDEDAHSGERPDIPPVRGPVAIILLRDEELDGLCVFSSFHRRHFTPLNYPRTS